MIKKGLLVVMFLILMAPGLRAETWPQFGLVWVGVTDAAQEAARFSFDWASLNQTSQMLKNNPKGFYAPDMNLIYISPANPWYCPANYAEVLAHPEWLLHDAAGKLIPLNDGWRCNIGSPEFCDYIIEQTRLIMDYYGLKDLGVDNGMFQYVPVGCVELPTNQAFQDAFAYFYQRLHEFLAARSGRLAVNQGSSELPVFARMMQFIDVALYEDIPATVPDNGLGGGVLGRVSRAEWCALHGKGFVLRHHVAHPMTSADFDFGYAVLLMGAGTGHPDIWYSPHDSTLLPINFPRISLDLGLPLHDREQIKPGIFRRQFGKCDVYLNLTAQSVRLTYTLTLAPMSAQFVVHQAKR